MLIITHMFLKTLFDLHKSVFVCNNPIGSVTSETLNDKTSYVRLLSFNILLKKKNNFCWFLSRFYKETRFIHHKMLNSLTQCVRLTEIDRKFDDKHFFAKYIAISLYVNCGNFTTHVEGSMNIYVWEFCKLWKCLIWLLRAGEH